MTTMPNATSARLYVPTRTQAQCDRERDAERLDRIQRGKLLFKGAWRTLLLDMLATQHNYRAVKNHSGKISALMEKLNVYRLACQKHADLLMLVTPTVTIGEDFPAQREAWKRIARDSLINTKFYEAAIAANSESEAWLGVVREENRTVIRLFESTQCFPVGPIGADGQPRVIDRRWMIRTSEGFSIGGLPPRERFFLRIERHSAPNGVGQIENFAVEVESASACDIPDSTAKVDLTTILGPAAPPPLQVTGATRPLIVRLANLLLNDVPQPAVPKDDVDLIDQLAATFSQLARVMSKHADPKMRVPESMLDKDGRVDSAKMEAFTDPEKEAEYLAWDAKIDMVLAVLEKLINWLLIVLEMSPSLVGLRTGAAPESSEKLMLESTNTTVRAERCAAYWAPSLERLIQTALEFEATAGLGFAVGPVAVKINPGLARTHQELARDLDEQHRAGQVDEQSMLEELHGPEKARIIAQRLAEERSLQQRMLMAEPVPAEETGAGDGGDAQAAAAAEGSAAA